MAADYKRFEIPSRTCIPHERNAAATAADNDPFFVSKGFRRNTACIRRRGKTKNFRHLSARPTRTEYGPPPFLSVTSPHIRKHVNV